MQFCPVGHERIRHNTLYNTLKADEASFQTLELIGDAAAPGLIAGAVYAGHMAARHFEKDPEEVAQQFFRREMVSLQ